MQHKTPHKFHMESGKTYAWCSCGFSGLDPLCDASHRNMNTDRRSVKFQSDVTQDVWLCGCKQTKTPPYCDGSHANSE
jgi:CDGSH-type Zn-finger protein